MQNTVEIQSVLETEHKLETVLLGIRVPMRPIPVAGIVRLVLNLTCGYPESDRLVWLRSDLDCDKDQKEARDETDLR